MAFGILTCSSDGPTKLPSKALAPFEEITAGAVIGVITIGSASDFQGDVMVGVEECRDGGNVHPDGAFFESAVVQLCAVTSRDC